MQDLDKRLDADLVEAARELRYAVERLRELDDTLVDDVVAASNHLGEVLSAWGDHLPRPELKLAFIIERHEKRCGCEGEACDLGSDLAEFDRHHGPSLVLGSAVNRYEAWQIAKRYVRSYQPPPTCGHAWSRWFGLVLRWRTCESCRLVEGRLG